MPARKPEQEKEVLDWIQAVLGEPVPDGEFEEVFVMNIFHVEQCFAVNLIFFDPHKSILIKAETFQVLKNGVILCKLMNKISPGAVPKFKEKGMPFILMENIQAFLVTKNL